MRIRSVRKNKRVCCIIAVLLTLAMLLTFAQVWADSAAAVQWCGEENENLVYLPEGDLTAKVTNAPQEGTLFLAVYDGDVLESCGTAPIQPGGDARVSTTVSASADCAKLFLWDMETMSPLVPVLGELKADPLVYRGFAGIYQNIYVNGHKIRERDEKLVVDGSDPGDMSDQFLPRDMGDGSYAFESRSSNPPHSVAYEAGWDEEYDEPIIKYKDEYNGYTHRIATADPGAALPAAMYKFDHTNMATEASFEGMNDNTQHWIREKSKEYTASQPSYYLRNLENGKYMGLSEDGAVVIAVNEDEKATIIFRPLKEESPLYLLSKTQAWADLTEEHRARIVRVYESVAGDAFERHGTAMSENASPRGRIDELYKKGRKPSETEIKNMLAKYISLTSGFVTEHRSSTYHVSTELPGTAGTQVSHGEERIEVGHPKWYGWTRNAAKKFRVYTLTIIEADSVSRQDIEVWVAVDDSIAKTNAERFEKIIGKIPQVYRHVMKTMLVEKDSFNAFWSSGEHLYIRTSGTESENGILDSIMHELGHSLDWRAGSNGAWWTSVTDKWKKAQEADMFSMSSYGSQRGTTAEEFAEFCRFYFACYGNRDRQRALQILCPNRYELFKQIREDYLDGFSLWEDGITDPKN